MRGLPGVCLAGRRLPPYAAARQGEEGDGAIALGARLEPLVLPSPSLRLWARLRSIRERRVCILAPLQGGLWLEPFPWMLPSWSLAEEREFPNCDKCLLEKMCLYLPVVRSIRLCFGKAVSSPAIWTTSSQKKAQKCFALQRFRNPVFLVPQFAALTPSNVNCHGDVPSWLYVLPREPHKWSFSLPFVSGGKLLFSSWVWLRNENQGMVPREPLSRGVIIKKLLPWSAVILNKVSLWCGWRWLAVISHQRDGHGFAFRHSESGL